MHHEGGNLRVHVLWPSLRHALHHNALQKGLLCMEGHAYLRNTDIRTGENAVEVYSYVVSATCAGL